MLQPIKEDMTKNSIICNLIHDNADWRRIMENKYIAVKDEGDLAIFNYVSGCDFADPYVQEARGIIIDTRKCEVVCWPFRKFGNFGESYADSIDWSTARVQEKVDGSIITLWFNKEVDRWQWSTYGMIDASNATTLSGTHSFGELIQSAINYNEIQFDSLDKNNTYIFELVSPEQPIIIQYDLTMLYHTGTRSNLTGEEFIVDIGMKMPASYALHSLEDCINAAKALNTDKQDIKYEGFVVVDKDWHRVKIKSPDYLYAHKLSENHNYTMKRILPLVLGDQEVLEDLMRVSPDSILYVRYYQYQYELLKRNARISMIKARALYEEFSNDRRAVAAAIKDDPYSWFAFKGIGNDRTAEEIIEKTPLIGIMKYIQEFEEE